MPGGTSTNIAAPHTKDGETDRAIQTVADAVRDTQTDLTRNGRLLTGTRDGGYFIAAGASLDVAHGLGHKHRLMLVSPLTFGATSVYENRAGVPAALRNTHVHLFNGAGAGNDATFYLWVV